MASGKKSTKWQIPNNSDGGSLKPVMHMIKTYDGGLQQRVYATMSLKDGNISAPIFSNPNHDAAELITDNNRIVYGARYKDSKPAANFLILN